MTDATTRRDVGVLLATVLLASSLPAIAGSAPALPDGAAFAPALGLTVLVGVAVVGYEYVRGDLDRFASTRSRALLYAVFAFYVTATLTVALVAVRLGGDELRSLPVVAWTAVSSALVAILVRRRVRAGDGDARADDTE